MLDCLDHGLLAMSFQPVLDFLSSFKNYLLIFLGFSLVIFFHELGHFLAAKFCNVRVDRFAVGFGKAMFSYRKGIGFRWGSGMAEYRRKLADQVERERARAGQAADRGEASEVELEAAAKALRMGETEYCFNVLPLGGYVKMLGQEDFAIDKSGELVVRDDPRAFTHKSVGQRMIIVSAGVVMNLIFASVVFMLVFMMGMKAMAPKIGVVRAETPADYAGLRANDEFISIDGQRISDFNDVMPAVMLADPGTPLQVKVRRPIGNGEYKELTLSVPTARDTEENKQIMGVAPAFNNRVANVMPDPRLPDDQQVRDGDVIESVNGKPVKDLFEIHQALASLRGQFADLVVSRKGPDGKETKVHVKRRARLAFRRTIKDPKAPEKEPSGHLLGFVPRCEVTVVNAGERADKAGIRAGDVVARWGQQVAPKAQEIIDSVRQNPERAIPVTLIRAKPDGTSEEINTEVTPKATGLFRNGTARIGADFYGQETERLVVADIADKVTDSIATPAAGLKIPRGAMITKVNGEPVQSWIELVDRFIKLGGQDVTITWTINNQPEQVSKLHVPKTLGTIFPLEPSDLISRIGEDTSIQVSQDDKPVTWPVKQWQGASEVLRKYLGQTVEVKYGYLTDAVQKTAKVKVEPEMLDTWVQRIEYSVFETMLTEPEVITVQVKNPVTAMQIGLQKTYYFIEQVYVMMKRMVFTRSVSFDQVSGPVGIVKMGSEVASQDFTRLLYFLGLISANLAVINFLPLPIVDGGLFMFLLIEKIKGSPISIRVMVATQLIGIVLIIGVFIFVTFQDLQRFLG